MDHFVPLSIPNFEGNEKIYVEKAIEQGWVSSGGSFITRFEEKIAEYINTHSVTACQSGTSALHLSLIDSGIKPKDMVIVPTLTFIAAVNPVRYQLAEPVFMDCDDSLCIDPVKLQQFCEEECDFIQGNLIHIETGKQVKAIIVVHVFGNLADMEAIMLIARKYHLIVIEDATEALGTYYLEGEFKGKYAGTIGDYGAFSFNGNKIITTGGGGAITANNSERISHLRYLSTQAKDDPFNYIHNEIGYNYRMTNLQAALGVAQMEEISEFIRRKRKNYDLYKSLFEEFELGKILKFRENTYSNKWFYSLEIPMKRINGTIDDIIAKLQEESIQSRSIWGLIHEQLPYKDSISYKIERAIYYSKCILNLPSSTQITEDEIYYVVDKVKETLGVLSNG